MEYRHGQEKLKNPFSQPHLLHIYSSPNIVRRNMQDKYWRLEDLVTIIINDGTDRKALSWRGSTLLLPRTKHPAVEGRFRSPCQP